MGTREIISEVINPDTGFRDVTYRVGCNMITVTYDGNKAIQISSEILEAVDASELLADKEKEE